MKQIRVLVLAALLGTAAVNSTAQVGIAGGYCGAEAPYGMNLMWTLYSDSTLRISGSGDMADYYSAIEPNRPWENYFDKIKTIIIGDSVTSIGGYAFPPFLYLPITSSVTIGNSVTKIGGGAFRNCFNLASLTITATIPPILYSNTFQNVSATIPVHVPCGSISAYQNSAYWSNFSNYIGIGFTDTTFIFDTVCYGMPYNNNDFNITEGAGIYCRTIPSVHYCDSVIRLTLAEYPLVSIMQYADTIYYGGMYNDANFTNLTQAGTYYDTLISVRGCDSIIELTLTVTGVGIVETDNYPSLRIYPNPTDGLLLIEIAGRLPNDVQGIEVYDETGKILLSLQSLQSFLDISHLPSGTYFIRINNRINKINKK